MQSRDNPARLGFMGDAGRSILEDVPSRDGSAELEKARAEFRLGHLGAASILLRDLVRQVESRLNEEDGWQIKANYAASRVLRARIYEEQKMPEKCQELVAEAMDVYRSISDRLENLLIPAFGDYGIALEMFGRHEEAIPWLERARKMGLDPGSISHYLGLAQKALGLNEAAVQTLTEAKRYDPGDVVAIEALGDVLAALGHDVEAADAYWGAALGYYRKRDYDHAGELLTASSRLRPEADPKDLGLLAAVVYRHGRFTEALDLADQAMKIAPPNLIAGGFNVITSIWYLKGRILLQMGQWQEAAVDFQVALDRDPDNSLALDGQAKAFMHLGKWDEALPLLERALKREPHNITFLADKSMTLRSLGRKEEAAATVHQSLQMSTTSTIELEIRAATLMEMRMFDEAAADFRLITELDSSQFEAWLSLAEALRKGGHCEEGLGILREAAERFSDLASGEAGRCQTALGHALRDQGQMQRAVAAFEKGYELNPDLNGFLGLVDVLRELQEYGRAFAVVEYFLAKHAPAPVEALHRKARLLCDIGEFEEAYELLRPLDAKSAAIFVSRGRALQNLGTEFAQRALAEYEQAIALDPSDPWYKNYKANTLRMLDKPAEAAEIYHDIARDLGKRHASLETYDLWLLGWCQLCLGDLCQAIRYLTAVPTTNTAAFPQFDLALAYLCDRRASLAERAYSEALNLVEEKNRMRRRSLLTAAVRDLEVASHLGQIPEESQEAFNRILRLLRTALSEGPGQDLQKAG